MVIVFIVKPKISPSIRKLSQFNISFFAFTGAIKEILEEKTYKDIGLESLQQQRSYKKPSTFDKFF